LRPRQRRVSPLATPLVTFAMFPRRDPRIMVDCFRPSAENLGGRVMRGTIWIALFVALRAMTAIASTAILARLLTPADFGLNAMAAVTVEIAAIVCMFGLPSIIVQLPKLTRLDLDTGFWLSVAVGTAAASAVILASPVIASLFKEPRLAPILWAMSSMILLEELSAVHFGIANRLLLVRQEVICQTVSLLTRVAVGVSLAFAGFGVWSLVWSSVAGRTAYCALLCWYIPFVPRLRFSRAFVRRNWRAAGSYLGSSALFYVGASADSAIVGRVFGATSLGFYQMAFSMPEELRSRIAVAVVRVLFPAFALLQLDLAAFRANVLRSLRVLAAIVMPMGVGMAILADPIVRVLYGSQWLAAVPLLQVAALTGIVRALHAFFINLYQAKGRPDLEFKIGLVLVPVFALALLIGALHGTAGIAFGVLGFSIVSLASSHYALRLLELGVLPVLRALLPATAATAFMYSGLLALKALDALPAEPLVVNLAVSVGLGVLLFFLPLVLFSRRTVEDLRSMAILLRRRPVTGSQERQ
jgi:PST family polysaccharide transporter